MICREGADRQMAVIEDRQLAGMVQPPVFSKQPLRGEALYYQIANQIKSWISDGKVGVGQKLLPERMLAKGFQVSYMTVRNAIGLLVQEGVLVRKHGKGIYVIHNPRADFAEQTHSIAVVFGNGPTLFRDYYSTIISGISAGCHEQGASMQMLCTAGGGLLANRNALFREMIVNRQIDGLVILDPLAAEDIELLIQGSRLPFVSIDPYKNACCPSAVLNHPEATAELTNYLWQMGHRDMALLVRPLDHGESVYHTGRPTRSTRGIGGRWPRWACHCAKTASWNVRRASAASRNAFGGCCRRLRRRPHSSPDRSPS